MWANSPGASAYTAIRDHRFGPQLLHLHLSVGEWTGDGLLAIFFVAGLELKRDFVAGELRDPRKAALPVVAAVGGMAGPALRTFLLTLAVVDDLVAITIIAIFYTHELHPLVLLTAAVPLVAFTLLVQRRVRSWSLLWPLAAATWALVHAAGGHPTVAGVLLGLAVPVLRSHAAG